MFFTGQGNICSQQVNFHKYNISLDVDLHRKPLAQNCWGVDTFPPAQT